MKDIIIIIVGLLLFALVWGVWQHFESTRGTALPLRPIACTDDAKMCSDGSFVGRIPPGCEFSDCPE